jgi:ubiquinone/menaquinone biosynthesis C-methylase UbiE
VKREDFCVARSAQIKAGVDLTHGRVGLYSRPPIIIHSEESSHMNEFDQKAAQWDAKPVRVERAKAVAASIKAAVPLSPKKTALEYGCGTGLVSFALQSQLGHITLADSSIGMLTVLRDKIAAGNIQNMTPVQVDLITDPLPAERYQLIYTLLTLHHIPDTDKILRAFYDLLDPQGYLCVADLDQEDGTFHADEFHGHLGFDRDELAAQAAQIGFQNIRFTTAFHMIKDVQGTSKDFPIFLMTAQK